MLAASTEVAAAVSARAIFVYAESVLDPGGLRKMVGRGIEVIVAVRDDAVGRQVETLGFRTIQVPDVALTRMSQVKTAAVIAFSQRLLDTGDSVVFLVGPVRGLVDTMLVVRIGEEWEMFRTTDQPRLTEHVKRVVFERTLRIALELAAEGREGKPVGALFVVGDTRNVAQYSRQQILNPFKGYPESERNILDDRVRETVKMFATLDGAFIVKGNGVITSAGTFLTHLKSGEPLEQGLGARHGAAAGITASTRCLAVTVSESTGTVRVWRRGQMITEIEKAHPVRDQGSVPALD